MDVKTHRIDTTFNMPNLTSVARLAKLYENDSSYFSILLVRYSVDGLRVKADHVIFEPIEHLDWKCLTIGALGKGQIQIADANHMTIRPCPRTEWMQTFCERVLSFYRKEITKLGRRIEQFEEIQRRWRART